MRRTALIITLVTALATLVLASAGSAGAANKNAQTLHFTCDGGITFTGNTIAQNNAIVVQITEGASRTFVLTNVTADDGTVFVNVPGFEDQQTLACRIEEFPGAVFTGFFAPRSG
jgi:spore coat protein U-like protein